MKKIEIAVNFKLQIKFYCAAKTGEQTDPKYCFDNFALEL